LTRTPEDRRQLQLLLSSVGIEGTGRDRYAAAMYFWQRRKLGDKALEIFRALAKDDDTDPAQVLQHAGLAEELKTLQHDLDQQS
jgi:hypothetical protein